MTRPRCERCGAVLRAYHCSPKWCRTFRTWSANDRRKLKGRKMQHKITLFYVDGHISDISEDGPENPRLEDVHKICLPILAEATGLPPGDIEVAYFVTPLTDGDAVIVVDMRGHLRDWPRNQSATDLFRAHDLRQTPGLDPEALSAIYGPAVAFHRIRKA